MKAGYERDRNASAKALRASIKNSKRDKILYGAVIKAESLFNSPLNTISTQTGPGLIGVTGTQSGPGSNDLKQLQQERALFLDTTVRPRDSVSNRVSPVSSSIAMMSPTSSSVSLTRSEPFVKPKVDIGGPRIPITLVDELKSKLNQRNLGLRPRDSRQSNVSIGSTNGSDSAPRPSFTSTVSSTASSAETIESKRPIPVAVNTETSSIAPTVASTLTDATSDATPATPGIKYDPNGVEIQLKAKTFFEADQAARANIGSGKTNQLTTTPYNYDGTGREGHRLVVKTESNGRFRFDLKRIGTKQKKSISLMKDDNGVDIFGSLNIGFGKLKQGTTNVGRRTGETSGYGLDSDEAKIASQRVVYNNRKSGVNIKKGQLYVMEPQLIKGHVRLYNKSGRPVVSRSGVSPSFQRIVKDIVERNTFEADDFSSLDPKETADANKFIQATKPIQPRNINRLGNADTVWTLKKRYEVLVGELAAGNSGKLVRDEMESILRDLIRLHAMNETKGRQLIKALREF